MNRRSRYLVGALSVLVLLLGLAVAAAATKPVPKDGAYSTTAMIAGHPVSESFSVSKQGKGATFQLDLTVVCASPAGTIPTSATITNANLNAAGKATPLAIKNGKFSYNGTIYNSIAANGTAVITGTFKSPTKFTGSAQFSWPSAELAPGLEGSCEASKFTFSGTHE
jgi:hypothetical protein